MHERESRIMSRAVCRTLLKVPRAGRGAKPKASGGETEEAGGDSEEANGERGAKTKASGGETEEAGGDSEEANGESDYCDVIQGELNEWSDQQYCPQRVYCVPQPVENVVQSESGDGHVHDYCTTDKATTLWCQDQCEHGTHRDDECIIMPPASTESWDVSVNLPAGKSQKDRADSNWSELSTHDELTTAVVVPHPSLERMSRLATEGRSPYPLFHPSSGFPPATVNISVNTFVLGNLSSTRVTSFPVSRPTVPTLNRVGEPAWLQQVPQTERHFKISCNSTPATPHIRRSYSLIDHSPTGSVHRAQETPLATKESVAQSVGRKKIYRKPSDQSTSATLSDHDSHMSALSLSDQTPISSPIATGISPLIIPASFTSASLTAMAQDIGQCKLPTSNDIGHVTLREGEKKRDYHGDTIGFPRSKSRPRFDATPLVASQQVLRLEEYPRRCQQCEEIRESSNCTLTDMCSLPLMSPTSEPTRTARRKVIKRALPALVEAPATREAEEIPDVEETSGQPCPKSKVQKLKHSIFSRFFSFYRRDDSGEAANRRVTNRKSCFSKLLIDTKVLDQIWPEPDSSNEDAEDSHREEDADAPVSHGAASQELRYRGMTHSDFRGSTTERDHRIRTKSEFHARTKSDFHTRTKSDFTICHTQHYNHTSVGTIRRATLTPPPSVPVSVPISVPAEGYQIPQTMRLLLLLATPGIAHGSRFRSASDSRACWASQLVSNPSAANITWASPIFFPGQPNGRNANRLKTRSELERRKRFRDVAQADSLKYQSYKEVVCNGGGVRGVGVLWCSPLVMQLHNMRFGLGPVDEFVVSLDEKTEMALHVSGVQSIFLHDDWHQLFCRLLPEVDEDNNNNKNNNNNDFIKSMLRPRRDVAGGSQVDNDGNVSQWCCAVLQVDPWYKLLRPYESGAGNGLCLNDCAKMNPTTGSVSRKETDYSPGSEYTMFQPTHRSATTGSFGSSDIRSAEQQAESLKSPSAVASGVKIEVPCQNATDFTTPRYPQFDFVRGRISSRDGPVPSPPRLRSRSSLAEDSNESCWDYVPIFFPNYAQRKSFVQFLQLHQKLRLLQESEIDISPPTYISDF